MSTWSARHLDPLDQSDENEPGSQRRQRAPAGCEFAGASDQSLLFRRRLDVMLDELEHAFWVREQPADSIGDKGLDLGGREAQPGGRRGLALGDQRARDIIAVAGAVLDRMRRGHPMAVAVKDQPGQQARAFDMAAASVLDCVLGEPPLHRIPQLLVDDRLVLTGIGVVAVDDLAAVDPVPQHQVERAAGDRLAAPAAPRSAGPALADDPPGFEFLLEQPHRAERGVAKEDLTHGLSLGLDHDEPVLAHRIAERRDPAHPHPLLLRGSDLVANALAGDLALELGEREKNVEGQTSHRGRGVELLGDRDERHVLLIEDLDDLGEIGERAGQPVDLVDDHDIDLAGADIGKQQLQARPLHIAAGTPAIVVGLGQTHPALVALALDERLAGLALGMQRVESLLQPLFGRFAGVDGTAQTVPARWADVLTHRRAQPLSGTAGA